MNKQAPQYHDPNALVQTDWLEDHLDDPALRIFDCTTYLLPATDGVDAPYLVGSGRPDYEKSHIPGAGFLDLQGDLSDNTTSLSLRFTAPSAEQFGAALSRAGIGEHNRVILYSAGHIMWATRVWWMMCAYGFDNAAVLDGGWDKWQAENRPVSDEPCRYPPAQFNARLREGFFVDKHAVLALLNSTEENSVIINALSPQYHSGLEASRYGRPGRIPGSCNIPATALLDKTDKTFVSLEQAKAQFDAYDVDGAQTIVTYCGGGIAATVDLFMLYQLGYGNLTLYDASLSEWAADGSLPIETD